MDMFDSIYVGPAGTIEGEKLQSKREERYIIDAANPNDCWEAYRNKQFFVTKFVVAADGAFELEGQFIDVT